MTAPLDDLVTRHDRDLVQFMRRRVRCPEDAADLAQETYLRLARMAHRDDIQDPSSYLFRTAQHLAIDHLRRSGRAGAMGRISAETSSIADPAPSPETSGAFSDRDREGLRSWLAESDDHVRAYAEGRALWQVLEGLKDRSVVADTLASLERAKAARNSRRRRGWEGLGSPPACSSGSS